MGHILERCSTVVREKFKGLFYNSSYKPFKHFWKYSKHSKMFKNNSGTFIERYMGHFFYKRYSTIVPESS